MTDMYRNWRSMAAIVAALVLAGCSPGIEVTAPFVQHDIELQSFGLFDLGVADVNGDGRLDLFTSAHSGPQSLALNQGDVTFTDVFTGWQLDQDLAFPGLAVRSDEPTLSAAGLYVNWRGPDVVVRTHRLTGNAPVGGTIELVSAVTLVEAEGFSVEIEAENLAPRVNRSVLHFSGGPDGHFAFRPQQHALPITFRVDAGVPAGQIYVGPKAATPKSLEFAINMRDRHGMAWADYDSDGEMDLFMTRGGLQGTMKYTPLRFWDELFVHRAGAMSDIATTVGLEKHGCPGREAAWVDFDQDGKLDLYVVCGRDGGGEDFANQLFRQTDTGAFLEVAHAVGVDFGSEGKFAWLDDDGDGDTDLLWVDRAGIYRYEHTDGGFRRQQLSAFAKSPDATGLRLGDADGDGDTDVFVESRSDSRLLLRDAGGYAVTDPAKVGLPTRNFAANFVDVDNDGVEEFHSVPAGLFRRSPDGRYRATGELRWRGKAWAISELTDAHATWADLDNDGARDLLVATNLATKPRGWAHWLARASGESSPQKGPLRGHWSTQVLTSSKPANHWLQVDLVGPRGNRQGIGARIGVHSGSHDQFQFVGHAEGSRYSQGHYRVYFGLGARTTLDRLTVSWPNGTRQIITNPPVDQRMTVIWNAADVTPISREPGSHDPHMPRPAVD